MKILTFLVFMLASVSVHAADPLRLGLLHTLSPAPFYIAQERGYFRDEGIDLTFRFFEAAQPIAAAAVAGDIDVGVTALTGGFFNLAEKGTLKVIGGGLHEERGYQGSAILVSNQAFDAGLTSLAKLAGHSFAITQYGSSFHYMLGRIAEARALRREASVTLRPVQQIANMVAAVQQRPGGCDDRHCLDGKAAGGGGAGAHHRLGRRYRAVSDHRAVHDRRDDRAARGPAAAFCRAYQKGVADYREAFLRLDAAGQADRRCQDRCGDSADRKIRVHRRSEGARKIIGGVGYYDAGGALDVADVDRATCLVQGAGSGEGRCGPATMIDTQFLPTR